MKYLFSIRWVFLLNTTVYSQIHGQSGLQLESSQKKNKSEINIKIIVDHTSFEKDSIEIQFLPVDVTEVRWESIKTKIVQGVAKWKIKTDEPVLVLTKNISKNQNNYWLAELNDNVTIDFSEDNVKFSGKGVEKYRALAKVIYLKRSIQKPSNPVDSYTKSLEDYFEWNRYLNRQTALLIPALNFYRNKISSFAFNVIRDIIVDDIIDNRSDKFSSFLTFARKNGFTPKNISEIYDSTYYVNTLKWVHPLSGVYFGSWEFVGFQAEREYLFDRDHDHINTPLKRQLLTYKLGKKVYTGQSREKFSLFFLTKVMMKEFGYIPETEALLAEYYKHTGYTKYRKYIKEFEDKQRQLVTGNSAPDFYLTDIMGQLYTKQKLKGKIALLDFWYSGCTGCIQMTPVLKKIEEEFKNDSNVCFLSVSIDEDRARWIRSIDQKKYTTGNGINLYTGGQGDEHNMIRSYSISGYPSLYLIDPYGKIIENPLPDPRKDSGSYLINTIQNQLALLKDGPYVFYNKDSIFSYYIEGENVVIKDSKQLEIQTNEPGRKFNVDLKRNLKTEPAEFSKPSKLFALSDIEGNFEAFKKLLFVNGIIDESFNWTFGEGHLIINGDVFDRGKQVTECLWLIYSLEEKAKLAGGYIHFILGNHELMNLSGNLSYVKEKYLQNSVKIGKEYNDLYSKESELGRWLRTKNIIEKIGDLLFVHAGISKEVNELQMSVGQINDLARPFYDNDSGVKKNTNHFLNTIFDSKLSPFWYRLYYQDEEMKFMLAAEGLDTVYKTPYEQINATLNRFSVNRIITGHTIVADTISLHYDGKVINTDTKHAEGKSEALLIEASRYYRVNQEGKRVLLFDDNMIANRICVQ